MPFERPTLSALVTRIRSDIRARLSFANVLLRRTFVDILAAVWAGAAHLLHGHLEWVARQLFPDTSEREFLLRQAAMYDITPTPATYASGTVTATGTDGEDIVTGTVMVRASDGATYEVTADATIAGGEATVSVEATLAGDAGNLDAGEILSFETPIAGVDSEVTVDVDGLAGGHDEEGTEEVRDRLILRLQQPPTGGSDQDYIAWALEVAGVTRAWVFRHENGLGTVVVRFVMDGQNPIIPSAGDVTAVQTKLNSERPVTAEVTAEAPVALPVNFTIAVVPNTAAVKAAVEAELADLLLREAAPGDGLTDQGTILLSAIRTAIGVAEGLEDYTLTVPAADVEPDLGEIATMGTVTWS